jgi:hypothetical protein
MAKRSALRPSALEIATNPTLVARKESIDASFKPPEL